MLNRLFAALEGCIEDRRRYRAALEYNSRHTFSRGKDSQAGTWCCPTCCRVHHSHGTGKFSGPLFDACCTFPAGGRIGRVYATNV